jgi:hypothetical protein
MFVKEQGRIARFIQPETVASTAANVIGTAQATTYMKKGDFCTIMCTTGTMYFLSDSIGTVLTTSKNGWEMTAGDTLDFVAASSFIYTLSTAADGKFQMIVWEA